jgi:hypothetical protein
VDDDIGDDHRRAALSKPEKRRNSVEDDVGFGGIPSANKKAAFRKSFDSAVHAVFHSRNGLPLTSSPAPMRRGIKFDFDSGLNTPKVPISCIFNVLTFCTGTGTGMQCPFFNTRQRDSVKYSAKIEIPVFRNFKSSSNKFVLLFYYLHTTIFSAKKLLLFGR